MPNQSVGHLSHPFRLLREKRPTRAAPVRGRHVVCVLRSGCRGRGACANPLPWGYTWGDLRQKSPDGSSGPLYRMQYSSFCHRFLCDTNAQNPQTPFKGCRACLQVTAGRLHPRIQTVCVSYDRKGKGTRQGGASDVDSALWQHRSSAVLWPNRSKKGAIVAYNNICYTIGSETYRISSASGCSKSVAKCSGPSPFGADRRPTTSLSGPDTRRCSRVNSGRGRVFRIHAMPIT